MQDVVTIIHAKLKLVVTRAFDANDKIWCGLVSGSVGSYPNAARPANGSFGEWANPMPNGSFGPVVKSDDATFMQIRRQIPHWPETLRYSRSTRFWPMLCYAFTANSSERSTSL